MVTTKCRPCLLTRNSSVQVSNMITITGAGDHDPPEWLITMAGIRTATADAPPTALNAAALLADFAIASGLHYRGFGMKTQLNHLLSPVQKACVSPHHSGVTTMLDTLPYADLLAIHNALSEKPARRFDTRANGERRTAALMEERGLTLEQAADLADVVLGDHDGTGPIPRLNRPWIRKKRPRHWSPPPKPYRQRSRSEPTLHRS